MDEKEAQELADAGTIVSDDKKSEEKPLTTKMDSGSKSDIGKQNKKNKHCVS